MTDPQDQPNGAPYPTYPKLDWRRESAENRSILDAIYDRLADHGFTRITDETDSSSLLGDLSLLGWGWNVSPEDDGYWARVQIRNPSSSINSNGWLPIVALARSIDQQIRSLYEDGGSAAVQLALDRLKLRRD